MIGPKEKDESMLHQEDQDDNYENEKSRTSHKKLVKYRNNSISRNFLIQDESMIQNEEDENYDEKCNDQVFIFIRVPVYLIEL